MRDKTKLLDAAIVVRESTATSRELIQLALRCELATFWKRRTVIRKLTSIAVALLACTPARHRAEIRQAAPVVLTLADALARAKVNSPQFQAAVTELGLAREDRYQARAGVAARRGLQQQLSFTPKATVPQTGRYMGANGVHEYISQGVAHETIDAAGVFDYQRTAAAHALAKARTEIAARGLVVTVVQSYYGLLAAQSRTVNGERAYQEGQHFLELSRKLEEGGEVAHSDTIKAQIQANDLKRGWEEAKLAEQNARLSLAVLRFPELLSGLHAG